MEAPEIKKDAEILLIEDDPEQAAEMIKSLENHPMTGNVLWLEDGIQAMDYLLGSGIYTGRTVKNTPKMIFLDLKIPRKNGLDVLYEIRTTLSLKHIPVVFMCSSEKELEQVESYDLNVDNFILKPLDPLGLTNVMDSMNRSNHQKALQKSKR